MSLNRLLPDKPQPESSGQAVLLGSVFLGAGAILAQGTVLRSHEDSVSIGTHSAVLENSAVIGTREHPVRIGAVRIGSRVQILENAVLHLLPDNELVIEDDVVIGTGAMIHGCTI